VKVGTLTQIYRYPVKSMIGETLEATTLGDKGIPGDRAWAVRDELRGGIQGGKKIAGLMNCSARYLESPGEGNAPAPEITLPNGDVLSAADTDAAARIGAAVEREVTLWPIVSPERLEHYRRSPPDKEDFEEEWRDVFGRTADEPLPDLSKFPQELFEYESLPGTYFDAFPLLVLTKRSLESFAAVAPDSNIDVRRFRPNLLIETDSDERFPEQSWIGKRIKIGDVIVSIAMECPRCVMTTRAVADLPKDPGVMRKLVQETGGIFGVYASVEGAGSVRAGDAVELLD
jgi:uncharacterized protein YcbX